MVRYPISRSQNNAEVKIDAGLLNVGYAEALVYGLLGVFFWVAVAVLQ